MTTMIQDKRWLISIIIISVNIFKNEKINKYEYENVHEHEHGHEHEHEHGHENENENENEN